MLRVDASKFWPLLVFMTLLARGQTPDQESKPDRRDLVYYPGDTERPLPLGRKLTQNIWLDQRAIWTSPFHKGQEHAIEWLGFGALTASLVVTDRRTSKFLENGPTQVRWGTNVSQLGAGYTVLPVIAGFYLAGVATDNQKARETGILGGEALIDALIVSQVMKLASGRNRPNAPARPGSFFQGGASFPSGHSMEAWAMASVIAHE